MDTRKISKIRRIKSELEAATKTEKMRHQNIIGRIEKKIKINQQECDHPFRNVDIKKCSVCGMSFP